MDFKELLDEVFDLEHNDKILRALKNKEVEHKVNRKESVIYNIIEHGGN